LVLEGERIEGSAAVDEATLMSPTTSPSVHSPKRRVVTKGLLLPETPLVVFGRNRGKVDFGVLGGDFNFLVHQLPLLKLFN
jgi:hypothetical protein